MIQNAELEHLYLASPCPSRFVPSVRQWGLTPGDLAFILHDGEGGVVLLMGFTLLETNVYRYDCLMPSSDAKYGSLSGIQDWFISSVMVDHLAHEVVLTSFSIYSLFKRTSYALSKGLLVSSRCACDEPEYTQIADQADLSRLWEKDADRLSSIVFLVKK